MDNEGMNVHIFNEAVANLAEMRTDYAAQQTTYLGLIAHSIACIADSLERFVDQSNSNRKLPEAYSSEWAATLCNNGCTDDYISKMTARRDVTDA